MTRASVGRAHLLSFLAAVTIAGLLLAPIPKTLAAATAGASVPVDKLVHCGLFLLASSPWRRTFALLEVRALAIAVIGAALVYGGALEIAQGLLGDRQPELLDMLAGGAGAALFEILRRLRPRKEGNAESQPSDA